MKKIIISLLVCLLFIGCEPIQESLDTKQVYNIDIEASDWIESIDNNGLNRYYFCEREINGIDTYFYNSGGIMVYLVGNGFQQALPSTRYYENFQGEQWSRTIDYDFSKRNITFYVTNSDFADDPPEFMSFRIVLVW